MLPHFVVRCIVVLLAVYTVRNTVLLPSLGLKHRCGPMLPLHDVSYTPLPRLDVLLLPRLVWRYLMLLPCQRDGRRSRHRII